MAQKERTTTQRALKRRSSGSGGGAARAAAPGHAVLMLLVSAGLGACSNSGSDTGATSAELGCRAANQGLSAPEAPDTGSFWSFGTTVNPEVQAFADYGTAPSAGTGTCAGEWGFAQNLGGLKKVCCNSSEQTVTQPGAENDPPQTVGPILTALVGAAPTGSCLSSTAVSNLIADSDSRGQKIMEGVQKEAQAGQATREELTCPPTDSTVKARAEAGQTAIDNYRSTPKQPAGQIDTSDRPLPSLPTSVAKTIEKPLLPPPQVISNQPPQQPTSCPTAPGAPTTGGISSTWCQTSGPAPGSNPIFTPQMPAGGQ